MPKEGEIEIKTLSDCKLPEYSVERSSNQLTLEKIERQRMEQDRAGILFSNILKQVRGQIHSNEAHGTVCDSISYNQMGRNGRIEQSFFKTSTDQINYKQILGFELRRDDEEEMMM